MGETTTGVLAGVINAEMLGGVLDEVVSVLPIAIPVLIGFIGLRKGISFVTHTLRSA